MTSDRKPKAEREVDDSSRRTRLRGLPGPESRLRTTISRAWNESRVRTITRRLASITQQARIYRWLTAQPEPHPIVIDLRATYTVGPFLGIIQAVIGAVRSAKAVKIGRRVIVIVEDEELRLTSAAILAVALSVLLQPSPNSSQILILPVGLVFLAGVIGLAVDQSTIAISHSRTAGLVRSILQRL